jgi:L-amino acid N-acyltransferase YncA
VIIRDATEADLPAITDINNALILTTTVTWSEELETLEQRAAWFRRQLSDGHPVLVADEDGDVVGFITYEHFRGEGKWPGYRSTAEQSIHVRESHWGRGVGRALVEAVIERARTNGIHVMVAAVDTENEASIQFHQRLGFVEVARMPQTGQKFGRWLDLVLLQRMVDDRERP